MSGLDKISLAILYRKHAAKCDNKVLEVCNKRNSNCSSIMPTDPLHLDAPVVKKELIRCLTNYPEVDKNEFEDFKSFFVKKEQVPLPKKLKAEVNTNTSKNKPNNIISEKNKVKDVGFRTASAQLVYENAVKAGTPLPRYGCGLSRVGTSKETSYKPVLLPQNPTKSNMPQQPSCNTLPSNLKNIEPKMVELIESEIMVGGTPVEWNDIAGLKFVKKTIQEVIVLPMLRPDLFTGLRKPPKGILLFGPPGTGKTLLGKCVASQSKSTFFSVSASSLTSKWVGDGEKMVRALFAVARSREPAVIFIDEIDSLLTQRSSSEHEASRRIKTEFLVQLDGAMTSSDERVLLIGATNRPQELDEAARRRFIKRLYVPLPEFNDRCELLKKLVLKERNKLTDQNFIDIAKFSDGYSGADIRSLCAEAALGPVRCLGDEILNIDASKIRPIIMRDFEEALKQVKSSVSYKDLNQYIEWNNTYGSGVVASK